MGNQAGTCEGQAQTRSDRVYNLLDRIRHKANIVNDKSHRLMTPDNDSGRGESPCNDVFFDRLDDELRDIDEILSSAVSILEEVV